MSGFYMNGTVDTAAAGQKYWSDAAIDKAKEYVAGEAQKLSEEYNAKYATAQSELTARSAEIDSQYNSALTDITGKQAAFDSGVVALNEGARQTSVGYGNASSDTLQKRFESIEVVQKSGISLPLIALAAFVLYSYMKGKK